MPPTPTRDFTDVDETTAELRRYLNCKKVGSFLREVMGWTSGDRLEIVLRRYVHLRIANAGQKADEFIAEILEQSKD